MTNPRATLIRPNPMSRSGRAARLAAGVLLGGVALAACSTGTQTTALSGKTPGATASAKGAAGGSAKSRSGASSPSGLPAELASAYVKTVADRSSKFSLTFTETGASPSPITFSMSGESDFGNQSAEMTMNFANLLPASSSSIPASDLEFHMLAVGGKLYMEMPPALAEALNNGNQSVKPWIEMDLAPLESNSNKNAEPRMGFNPTAFLSVLTSQAESVTKVGTATIQGVKTTEYKATFNLTKLNAILSPALRSDLTSAEKLIGTNSITEYVWLDSSGLVRQMESSLAIPVPNGTETTTTKINFYDYGVAVHITPPPASEVSQLPSLTNLDQLFGN